MDSTTQPQPLYGVAVDLPDGELTMASLELFETPQQASAAAVGIERRTPVPGAAYWVVVVRPAEMDPWDLPDEDEDTDD